MVEIWLRVLIMVFSILAHPALAAAPAPDEFELLSNQYNEANRAHDLAEQKRLLNVMLALGDKRGLPFENLISVRMELVHLQIEEGKKGSIDAAYSALLNGALKAERVNPDLVAQIADEWVGIDTDWNQLAGLEAHVSAESTADNLPIYTRLAAARRFAFDFQLADGAMQTAFGLLPEASPAVRLAAALVQNNFAWRMYMQHNRYAEAQIELQLALSLAESLPSIGDRDLVVATITHNLAETMLNLNERQEAAALAKSALAARTERLGPLAAKVGESALLAARAVSDPKEEFDLLNQALQVYSAIPEYRSALYEGLVLRAGLLRRNKLLAEAARDIEIPYEGLAVDDAVAHLSDARPPLLNRFIARVLGEKSAVLDAQGDVEVAYTMSLLADEFYSLADGTTGPVPTNPDKIAQWQAKTSVEAIYQMLDTSRRALEKDDPSNGIQAAFRALGLAGSKLTAGTRYHDLLGGQYHSSRQNFANYHDIADQFLEALAQLGASDGDPTQWLDVSFLVFQQLSFSSTASAIELVQTREANAAEYWAVARRYFDTVARLRGVSADWLHAITEQLAADIAPFSMDYARDFSSLLAEVQRLDGQVEPSFLGMAEMNVASAAAAPAQLRKLLRPDEALLGLYCNDKATYAWTTTSVTSTIHTIEASCDRVRELTSTLRASAGVGGVRGPTPLAGYGSASVVQAASDAYASLLKPLEPAIGSRRHLIIIPTGDFIGVPWSMLVSSPPAPGSNSFAAANWLARTHSVSIVPSLAGFVTLRNAAERPRAPRPYLGIGDPVLGAPRRLASLGQPGDLSNYFRGGRANLAALRDLAELPETATEIQTVARTLNAEADTTLIGHAATERALRALSDNGQLRAFRVIHFATHGLIAGDLDGLAEPALVLSLPSEVSVDDDGLLTASEVSTLDLNADWAILSACNTAAGATASAEPLSGLARAFLYAGARSLLVSQWSVNSDAAVELITSTFSFAEKQGIDHSEALRLAMVKMIDSGRANPSLWAPFFVVGD